MAPRRPPAPKRRAAPSALLGERLHGDVEGPRQQAFAAVFDLVRRIPRGRVMTYGQIATWIEGRLSPRAVGWALHGCPEDLPWQRVVNASGGCSTERIPDIPPGLQRGLLEAEGVAFRANGTLDLTLYRWVPRAGPRPKRGKPREACGARTARSR